MPSSRSVAAAPAAFAIKLAFPRTHASLLSRSIVTVSRTRVLGAASALTDAAALGLGRAAGVGLALVAVALSTRILGPKGYATFAYVTIAATFLFTVGSGWTIAATLRYGREELELTGRMNAVTWERFMVTAPAVLATTVFVVILGAVGALPRTLGWPLLGIALVYGFVLVVSDHIVYALQSLGRMKASSLGVVSRQALVVAGLVAVLISGSTSVGVVTVVTIAAWAVLAVVFSSMIWSEALWPPVFSAELRRRIFVFSLPLTAFTLSQYVIQTVDLPLIGVFRTTRDVGLYALAYQAFTALQQVAAAVVSVLTPLFVSLRTAGQEESVRRFAQRMIPQFTLFAATIAGICLPLIPWLVPIVFGEGFEGSSAPLAILLTATVLLVTANLFAPILLLYEASRAVGIYNLAAALLNIVADLLLLAVFHLDIWAPAAATVASVAVIVWGYARATRPFTGRIPAARALVLLPVVPGLFASLALGGVARPLIGCVAALVTGCAILVRGGIVDRSDVEFVMRAGLPSPLRRILLRGIALASRVK
jgi:O-antigen/teichoic acid export membrane protein